MARTSPGGRIHLCEYAAENPDKTFTVIRGGIGRGYVSAAAPQAFYCLVEFDAGAVSAGQVPFDIVLVAPNGTELPVKRVSVHVDDGEPCRFAGKIPLYLYQPGRYLVRVRIGDLTAECPLDGVPIDAPGRED